MPIFDFAPYLSYTDSELWERLAQVTSQLANYKTILASNRAQEARVKSHTYWETESASSNIRDRAAREAAIEITCTIMEILGKIESLTEEQKFIENILWRTHATREGVQSQSS